MKQNFKENISKIHKINFPYVRIYLFIGIITIISIANYFIFHNFECEWVHLLQEAQGVHAWWVDPKVFTDHDRDLQNYALIVFHLIVACVRNMRDVYMELFFLSGVITLWIIVYDFHEQATHEWKESLDGNGNKGSLLPAYELYRKIANLSHAYSDVFGNGLCCYLMYYITYYSLHLESLFLRDGGLGRKIYFFEFIATFGAIYGFGAHFLYQVKLC